MTLFDQLADIDARPEPYAHLTTADLWTDPHVSERMLADHLAPDVDAASNRADHIEDAVAWLNGRFGLGPGGSVLDLGCGPGLYTSRLAAAGAEVVGVDLGPRSVEYARARARAGPGHPPRVRRLPRARPGGTLRPRRHGHA